jgi:hypothetical protein
MWSLSKHRDSRTFCYGLVSETLQKQMQSAYCGGHLFIRKGKWVGPMSLASSVESFTVFRECGSWRPVRGPLTSGQGRNDPNLQQDRPSSYRGQPETFHICLLLSWTSQSPPLRVLCVTQSHTRSCTRHCYCNSFCSLFNDAFSSSDYIVSNGVNVNNSVVLIREWTIPTERPPLVCEISANFCG